MVASIQRRRIKIQRRCIGTAWIRKRTTRQQPARRLLWPTLIQVLGRPIQLCRVQFCPAIATKDLIHGHKSTALLANWLHNASPFAAFSEKVSRFSEERASSGDQ